MMRTSREWINQLKRFETFSARAYWDVDAYSIGYGHHSKYLTKYTVWSLAQAEAQLIADLADFERHVNSYRLNINQHQFDALVDFEYNLGRLPDERVKELRANPNDQSIWYNHLVRYTSAGKRKNVPSLKARRLAEMQWYFGNSALTLPDDIDTPSSTTTVDPTSTSSLADYLASIYTNTTSGNRRYSANGSKKGPPKIQQGDQSKIVVDEMSLPQDSEDYDANDFVQDTELTPNPPEQTAQNTNSTASNSEANAENDYDANDYLILD